ncbi:hypothetical protein [Geodermatophilus sp. CPCC 205761]|uniref:hypothetical protein n=1 Tax=Geodermatophilus sp. CPCC 205761 TaxID=2936597 RepID=UPI003EEF10BE
MSAARDNVPLEGRSHFLILTILAALGFGMLWWVEKVPNQPENVRFGMSEAAAGLMAATLAVIVSHLSHRRGRARRAVVSTHGEDALGSRKSEGVLLLVASVGLVIVAILIAFYLEMSVAAAAALVAAVLSYALADLLHDTSSTVRTHHTWGWLFIAIVLVAAVVCIVSAPSVAEAVAAIAAAFVTFGGSLVGHGEGAAA